MKTPTKKTFSDHIAGINTIGTRRAVINLKNLWLDILPFAISYVYLKIVDVYFVSLKTNGE